MDVAARLACESPEEFEVKPWVVTDARIEGPVLLALAVRGYGRGSGDGAE